MGLKQKIYKLVTDNKLGTAIDFVIEKIVEKDKDNYNTLILLKSRYTANEKDFNAGIVARDDYSRTKSQISNSFLQTMNEIDEDILEDEPESKGNNSKSGNILTKKEIEGYQEILEKLIDKRIAFEKDLVVTYDSEKKYAIKEQIKELENKILELKQKVSGDLQKVSDTTNTNSIGNNSSGNFVFQGLSGGNINLEIKNGLVSMDSKLEKEVENLRKIVEDLQKDAPVKTKILFLAANPTDQARVQTDKEYNAIRLRLAASSQRDTYDFLMPEFALSIENLIKAMNQKPAIVHFSGHGEKEGILITNAQNETQQLPAAALLRLFKQHKDTMHLVVLNACHSAEQAKTISGLGFYVIGTNAAFSDEAAISFATGLYIGLGEGKSVEQAYDDAIIVLMTNHPEDSSIIEIWKDANKLDI
jgi:hypothetical protein